MKIRPFSKVVSLLVFVFTLNGLSAQTPSTGYDAKKTDAEQKILDKGKNYDVNFDISNHEAFFLEGEDSLFRYMYSKLTVPKEAADINLVSNAMISFQVNFDGKVQKVTSITKVGYGIDEQLAVTLASLEFVPATQGSLPYRSEIVLEIPVKAVYLYNIKSGS